MAEVEELVECHCTECGAKKLRQRSHYDDSTAHYVLMKCPDCFDGSPFGLSAVYLGADGQRVNSGEITMPIWGK